MWAARITLPFPTTLQARVAHLVRHTSLISEMKERKAEDAQTSFTPLLHDASQCTDTSTDRPPEGSSATINDSSSLPTAHDDQSLSHNDLTSIQSPRGADRIGASLSSSGFMSPLPPRGGLRLASRGDSSADGQIAMRRPSVRFHDDVGDPHPGVGEAFVPVLARIPLSGLRV
jgi:hypothetical protein